MEEAKKKAVNDRNSTQQSWAGSPIVDLAAQTMVSAAAQREVEQGLPI